VAASATFAHTPIVITEADPDGCAACPVSRAPQDAYRNSPAYGAYELAMMKRTLELSADMGVNLRGVLTWAFTFPGSPYFAGYRALATNGIRLPVLNALELLGSLRGARLSVASSGARPLSDILAGSVREQPDIDALAAVDGDRIQVLVWNYHDDLVDAPPVPVTLRVAIPPGFSPSRASRAVRVKHTRVDDTHGDAFSVWASQGSPPTPSAQQLAALREAMVPVVLDPDHVALVVGDAVTLSFDVPRFGVSLLELTPVRESEASPRSNPSCSCLCAASAPNRLLPLITLSLALALTVRRRFHARCAEDIRQ
jgi:xylan 1,4-beta-xylosidase